jgi:hypothetical protein
MPDTLSQESHWLAVIGRSCAYLCLHMADMKKKGLADQGSFLQSLGLSRSDAARIVGTTDESLRVLQQRQKSKRGRGGKKTVSPTGRY